MRVFLTGASGYIGAAVAEALLRHGHHVIGLARNQQVAARLIEHGIEPHAGDLMDPEPLAGAACRLDAVIHAALAQDPNAPLIDRGFVDATLAALAGSGKPFLYTSGVWVMGNTEGHAADEHSPAHPIEAVAWRVGVERIVMDAAANGVRTIVIRPAMVYGRGGGIVAGFVKSARETGAALHVGDGSNHWSFVHLDDLAELYVIALEKAPAGSLFIAASGPALRVRDVATAASKAAGAGARTRQWDPQAAYNQIGPWVQGLLLDQKVTGQKAQQQLGWIPHAPGVLEEVERGSYAR
jgi:nucleoside-diphosphate-sugar epimerase